MVVGIIIISIGNGLVSINLDYIARKSDLLNVSWLCNKEFYV